MKNLLIPWNCGQNKVFGSEGTCSLSECRSASFNNLPLKTDLIDADVV